MEANKRVEKDNNKSISPSTTPNGEKPATEKSSVGEKKSQKEPPKQDVAANNKARKHSDSNSDYEAERHKTQTKRKFPPENPDTKESFVAREESPKQSSKLHAAAISNINGNNSGGNKEVKINAQEKRDKEKGEQQSPHTEKSLPHTTEPMERVKPLRERQLKPLPHFGEIGGSPKQTSKQQSAANNSNSNSSKDGKIITQSKRDSPEKPASKDSLIAQSESPKHASKHRTVSDKHNKNDNSNVKGKSNANNSNDNKKGKLVKESTTNTERSSSFTALQGPDTEESPMGTTEPVERVKPLRERQLQPLPHFGDIAPPPLEFADSSGKKNRFLSVFLSVS